MSNSTRIVIMNANSKSEDSDSDTSNITVPSIESITDLESVENEKIRLRGKLNPLTHRESEELDIARRNIEEQSNGGNKEPKPVNDTSSELNLEDFKELDSDDDLKLTKPKINFKNFLIPETSDDAPHPVNDSSEPWARVFNNDWMKSILESYENIKVQKSVDSYGRNFYFFDDGKNVSLLVMVFSTQAGRMICINDTLLPLNEFLSITHAQYERRETKTDVPNLELRRSYGPVNDTNVRCHTCNSDKWFTIPNTTVNHIMSALLYLTKECAADIKLDFYKTKNESTGLFRLLWKYLW